MKLSKTFFSGLAGISIGGLLGGAICGLLWATEDWEKSPAAEPVCRLRPQFPRYPGECYDYHFPTFPIGEHLNVIIGFSVAGAMLLAAIFCVVKVPRRLRRRMTLGRSDW